jgi:hypothetical protein
VSITRDKKNFLSRISAGILYHARFVEHITVCKADVQIFGRNPGEKNPQKSEISAANQLQISCGNSDFR